MELILIACFVLVITCFLLIYNKIRNLKLLNTVTRSDRGTKSERDLVLKLLKMGIPSDMIFHDLYLQKNKGTFSQIDLVILTNVGIIVFEIKEYSGWIFGNGNYAQWTQVLAYGRSKYSFYNPIMQNKKHIEELKKQLKFFENAPYYSIVVFYGDCVLKDISFVPNGTFLVKSNRVLEVLSIIIKNNVQFQFAKINEVVRILKAAVLNGESKEIQNQHIEYINEMLRKDIRLE